MVGPLDEILAPPPAPAAPSFRYGTVTGTNPLRVRLDGDTNPVASTPTTIAAVTTGDRVLVMIYHRQLTVLGVVGGERPFAMMASGEVSVNALAHDNYDAYSVSFPSGRFTKPPRVFINAKATVPRRTFGANNISTDGFTLRTANYSDRESPAHTVYWLAVQLEA